MNACWIIVHFDSNSHLILLKYAISYLKRTYINTYIHTLQCTLQTKLVELHVCEMDAFSGVIFTQSLYQKFLDLFQAVIMVLLC